MIHVLADAVRAEHEAARSEGAFVQPLDRLSIAGGFGPDGEGKIVHRVGGISPWRATVHGIAPGLGGNFSSSRAAAGTGRRASSFPAARASRCRARAPTKPKAAP